MPLLTSLSGANAECVTNAIEDTWQPLATWLRANGRQAFNTETGGGNVDSCVGYLLQEIGYQANQSDGRFSPITVP
jgi:endoglucanase